MWIGYNCLIMSGVTIGKGSVIGARSVVAKSIPPYSIYIGNKVVRKRFPDEIISKLMEIDYSRIKHKRSDLYMRYCQTEIDVDNVEEVLNAFANYE